KDEMLALLKKQVKIIKEGDWVLGLNWDENNFSDPSIPTIQELDQISDKHPIFLTRTCTHAYLANTVAFKRAGLQAYQDDHADGTYGRDETGAFNGLIYEQAAEPFYNAQPVADYATKKAYVKRAIEHALRLGLTAAHTEDLRYVGDMDTLR